MKATILFIIGTVPALLCAGIYGATAAVVILAGVLWFTTRTAKGRAARFGLGRCLIKLENIFTNL